MNILSLVVQNRTPRVAAGIIVAAFCVVLSTGQPAAGQAPSAAVTDRDAEYAALAREVIGLERELGLVKRVVKLVTPGVVHIEARQVLEDRRIEEAGSGVIVEFGKKPYVLTNRHVIGNAAKDRIQIHLADGRILRPQVVWSDPWTDVAVISVDAAGLPAVKLGDSNALEIGDYVLAVGSPFGLSQSVTRGIVSAKGRHNLNLGANEKLLQDFIQTDAAINPGNSGGPLINLRGEVVGLNTAIASASGGNEGIGFSVPINVAAKVAAALVEGKQAPRGYLGVTLDADFNSERARALGLPRAVGTRVTDVKAQSPAEEAEIKVDDVILEFNGIRVEQDSHLISLVKLTDIGRSVEIVVLREGKPMRISVRIGDGTDEIAIGQRTPPPAQATRTGSGK